jgi:ubiquinone/menaquinone biosynthesis C-methylase UbiE
MQQTSKARQRIKYYLTKYLSPALIDKLRGFLSIRHKFIFNKHKQKKILEIKNKYKDTANNIDLLKELHQEFKTISLAANYSFENLLLSSRQRFNYLKDNKIPLKGIKMADFGAGHGDMLFLCKELKLAEAVALDFSDKDFLPHKNDLPPDVFDFIDFKCLDLVEEPLPISNFDLITSFSAFEHFEDPKTVLNKCYESLKVGGYMYVEFAAYNSPYATHRKIFSGVPHIQNIFNDDVAFEFFYDFLKINDKRNRYTNEPILDGNPYPEVNRLLIKDYEEIFLDPEKWDVIDYTKIYNYQYHWFIECFKNSFKDKDKDFIYVDYLKFLIKKK